MSWFGADSSVELDSKIEDAASESIPNGEIDMAVAMEITDLIRSKNVPPKQAMRALKKRLSKVYKNPNTLSATLKLCDLCVKNGGQHFLTEINSKEFIDYVVEFIFKVHYDVKSYKVYSSESKYAIGTQILRLVREWSMYFQGYNQGSHYLGRIYESLSNQGYKFPAVDAVLESNAKIFVDSQTPPDWVDGRDCMICYNPFSVINRKHHCRACGGVFCQTHSSKNVPLVSLGLLEPVRVCDDCLSIHKHSNGGHEQHSPKSNGAQRDSKKHIKINVVEDEEEQLKRAIQLSLKDSGVPGSYSERGLSVMHTDVTGQNPDDIIAATDNDEEMKAAIAASLAEYQQAHGLKIQNIPAHNLEIQKPVLSQLAEPDSEFYSNLLPLDGSHSFLPSGHSYEAQKIFSQVPHNFQHQPIAQESEQVKSQSIVDLVPQEEEFMNLFVQIMGGMKNDPVKQANIVYDQNLSDLHNKVLRLKPKLNRVTRFSIDKYEFFLEMNNKMSSIACLYDQFLDHKLNPPYGKHTLPSPGAPFFSNSKSSYGQQLIIGTNDITKTRQPVVSPNFTEYPRDLPYQPTSPQVQTHGRVNSREMLYQETGTQTLGPRQKDPYNSAYQYQSFLQTAPVPDIGAENRIVDGHPEPESNSPRTVNKYTISDNVSTKSIPYTFHPEVSPESLEIQGPEITISLENELPRESSKAYFANIQTTTYSQMPSSPPSDGISDTESVGSRYPALEDKYDTTNDMAEEGPRVHASSRFPSINDLKLSDLNSQPLAELKKSMTNESKKYKAEPEPLIEL